MEKIVLELQKKWGDSIIFLVLIIIFYLLIYNLKLELEFKNVEFNLEAEKLLNIKEERKLKILNDNSNIILKIKIFNRLVVYKKDITKIKIKNKIQKLNIDLQNKKSKLNFNNLLKQSEIKNLNLNIKLGTKNAMLTAILVGVISANLGILIGKYMKNNKELKYIINPLYDENNILKIKITGIIKLNFVKYIIKEKNLMPNKALS